MSEGLTVWRHPRPEGVAGRCIGGRTDVPVHWRRAKRLARRIQAHARRHRQAHVIWTSPLVRCAEVGRWLRSWGWRHHRLEALREIDFGSWDGRAWRDIPKEEIDAWVADFLDFAPAGGESLAALMQRVKTCPVPAGALVVSHGGWMLARRWQCMHGEARPSAAEWPCTPRYGECQQDFRG